MAKKRKTYDDDDGRVVANMNVEGMPWYVDKPKTPQSSENGQPLELTKEESRAITRGVIKATLLIAGVFALAALLFILFCIHVWLK